jgi:hypothetical protein
MATCAAVVDAKLPRESAEDSFNLLPAFLGTATEPIRTFTLHQTISLALAIRQGKWKLLDHKGSGGNNYSRGELQTYALPEDEPDAPGQLYNLLADPGETKNLYEAKPQLASRLKAKLQQTFAAGRSRP